MPRLLPLAAALLALAASAGRAQDVPRVGDPAPDFTIATVRAGDPVPRPFTLSAQRGRIVVLAFFPKARTSGCTAQMRAYRDQYSALFGDDSTVILLPISTDGPRRLADWARDLGAPFPFGADTSDDIGRRYGVKYPVLPIHRRHVVVVGPDGRVAYDARPFRELSQPAYDSLGAVVARLRAGNPAPPLRVPPSSP